MHHKKIKNKNHSLHATRHIFCDNRGFSRTLNLSLFYFFKKLLSRQRAFADNNLFNVIFVAKQKKAAAKLVSGFSLIELMVVIGIFALLSGVIFSNYGKFNVKASLDNLTHQVALVIRQAQVYGISVAQKNQKGYGVYFSTATPADQTTFILFNDRHGLFSPNSASDKLYNDENLSCNSIYPNDECIEKISIQSGDKVLQICGVGVDEGFCENLPNLHIVFTRPNPDASLIAICPSGNFSNFSHARIILQSPSGDKKSVVVWTTGQIAVESGIIPITQTQDCP